MKLDEWHAVLETEPATPNQVGAIMAEFRRLGFAGRYDRTERLAASAALLELGELDSMRDLVMGDAGRLLRMLQRFRDRAGLNAAVVAARSPAVLPRGMSFREVVLLAIGGWRELPRPPLR